MTHHKNLPFGILCSVIALFLFKATDLKAQDTTVKSHLKIARPNLTVDNGELKTVDVEISNPSSKPLAGTLKATPEGAIELVSRNELDVQVSPHQSFFTSFTINIPKRTRAQENLRLLVEFYDSTGGKPEQQYINITVTNTRNVNLYTLEQNVQLMPSQDSLRISVRVHNSGNTDQAIKLVAKFPSSTDEKGYMNALYNIKAFADTIIELRRAVNDQMLVQRHFAVNISAIYNDGDIAGIVSVQVQTLKTQKRFSNRSVYNSGSALSHAIEFNTQYLFTDYESYQLRGGSELYVNKTKLAYNIDAQAWKRSDIPIYMRDTYINIEKSNVGATVGNIIQNYDIILNGTGVMTYLSDTMHKSYYEAGWMAENYNPFGKGSYVSLENAKAVWARYQKKKNRFGINSIFIYEYNTTDKQSNSILQNAVSWQANSHLNLTVRGNAGLISVPAADIAKFSGSAGLDFTGNWNKINISGENSVSSGYYPGIYRGVTSLSERINYLGENFNLFTNFAFYRFDPQYVSLRGNNITSDFSTTRVEAGISFKLSEHFDGSLSPVYYHEISNYPLGNAGVLEATISSLGSGFQVSYNNSQRKRYVYFTGEAGGYKAPLTGVSTTQFHLKTTLSAKQGWINLNIFAQVGEFYAGEVVSRFFQKEDLTKTLTITPMLEHSFFHNKLNLQAGVSYTASNISTNGLQINGRAEYTYSSTGRVYASVINYRYDAVNFQSTDFRVGIIKQIPVAHITTGGKRLSIFVFKDYNNNNVFDDKDSVAGNFVIYINKEAFVSGADGYIQYKGLPVGNYTVSVPSRKGWHSPEQNISITGKTKLAIPLKKSSILSGGIEYAHQTAITFEVAKEKEQIKIYAVAEDGTVYMTKTDEEGKFIFFIPPGEYTVEIHEDEMPDKTECGNKKQTVTLAKGGAANIIFNFSLKEREVEVQKFISPSLKKPN